MNTNQNLDQTPAALPQAPKIAGRGGRPRGSKARIPAGHVTAAGLAEMLGLRESSIAAIEARGDPIIPPRSPIAGSGKHRRQIWRICDIVALTGVALGGEVVDATTRPPLAAQPAPAPAFAAISGPALGLPTSKPSTGRRKPGRPRGTGKFSK